MATVLVLGSGGREHALASCISQSGDVISVLVAPGNAGTASTPGMCSVDADLKDHEAIAKLCKEKNISLVVVGPEDPLSRGIADFLNKEGLKVFGPSQNAAKVESSKSWAKNFMVRHNIPTADFRVFTDVKKAKDFIKESNWKGWAVKASGLAAGKGVIVSSNRSDAMAAVDLVSSSFGEAGNVLVIEEKLEGEEVSVLCFTDGHTIAVMPPAQDRKRLQEGDLGPNTGGMGAYCPCPLITAEELKFVKTNILQKTVDALQVEGIPFVGALYAGLILTREGVKVLEFNCRFGDPETQVILPLLESDLFHITVACVEGRLSEVPVKFTEERCCVGICLVSDGYPGSYAKGKCIYGLDDVTSQKAVRIYHAGTQKKGGSFLTSGGRVLCVVAVDETIPTAAAAAAKAASMVTFSGVFFRKDIASKATMRGGSSKGRITYASAGVDITAGEALVSTIKGMAQDTVHPGVVGSLGLFGGMFDLKAADYKDPILVSGTDGIGTKVMIAQAIGKHDTVGQDLVAMCINDILMHGAEPLFFLDYLATSQLDVDIATDVVSGVAAGCRIAGCSLIGGETAEMPGLYHSKEYDLAGFAVGAVEKSFLMPHKDAMAVGDVLLGIPSSGLHSNGFSLVRKIVESQGFLYSDPSPFSSSKSLGEELLTPTKIYVKELLETFRSGVVKGAAHITGGGLTGNLPRIFPDHLSCQLLPGSWTIHPVFLWIAAQGVAADEMTKIFNLGLGVVLVVDPARVEDVRSLLRMEVTVPVIGTLTNRKEGIPRVDMAGFELHLQKEISTLLESYSLCQPIKQRVHVAVLISGSGTNLQALLEHTQCGLSAAEIVLVISNVAGIQGLQRARAFGVSTRVLPHKSFATRHEFEDAISRVLKEFEVDVICLAGFMRILTKEFVNFWKGRLLNIHPSLLPSFKGMHAQRQALEAKVKITGCTVHYVAEEVDGGEIITQEAVPILSDDKEEDLVERIKLAEHIAYPRALEAVARETLKLATAKSEV